MRSAAFLGSTNRMSQRLSRFALIYPARDERSIRLLMWADLMAESLYLRPSLNKDAAAVATEEMTNMRINFATVLTALVQGIRAASAASPLMTRSEEVYLYREPPAFGWLLKPDGTPMIPCGFTTDQVRVDQLVWVHAAIFAAVSHASRELVADKPVPESTRMIVVKAAALADATQALVDGWIESAQLMPELKPLIDQMAVWPDILDVVHSCTKLRGAGFLDTVAKKAKDSDNPVKAAHLSAKAAWHDLQNVTRTLRESGRITREVNSAVRVCYVRHLITCIEKKYLVLVDQSMEPDQIAPLAVAWLKRNGLGIRDPAKKQTQTVSSLFSGTEYDKDTPAYLRAHVTEAPDRPYTSLWPLKDVVKKHTDLRAFVVNLDTQ